MPMSRWHLADPWDLDRLTGLPRDAVVVLVGTGLTAVDAAITLLGDAPDRRVVMVSRHGSIAEANPLVADTFGALGLPAVAAMKLLLVILIGALTFAASTRGRRGVWPLVGEGLVRPIVHTTMPLEEAAAAHALMESSGNVGKILLTV